MEVPPVIWTDVGPWALVSGFVILIALGILVPRRTFNKVVEEKDKVIKKQDELINKMETALDKRDEQFERIFNRTEVIVQLLEDLKHAGQSQRTG